MSHCSTIKRARLDLNNRQNPPSTYPVPSEERREILAPTSYTNSGDEENDKEGQGKPSDHLIVVMKPLSNDHPIQQKTYKTITYRPFPDSGIREMGRWLQSQHWSEIYSLKDAHKKAEKFESMLLEKIAQQDAFKFFCFFMCIL